MPTDLWLSALMDSGEVMGRHRERVEQEKEPGTKSPVEKQPRKRHWGSKLWQWTDFGEKKLWDWLQLLSALAIPIVLAGAGFWFSAQQDSRQQAIEDQRAQDVALQAYFDQMGALMLEENLRHSERDSEPRTLARARTVTVLGRLDPERKRSAVQFLYESSLIDEADPVVDLSNADLSSVDLRLKDLINADLHEVDLREADLSGADLSGANLTDAILRDADLRNAEIEDGTSLGNADLSDADLSGATLTDANLTYATLERADLSGAYLRDADLSGAYLRDADLRDADLRSAEGVNKGTLKAQHVKLEGSTMPNGQEY
jgi:uncharacterized protein YjbI with pentapeptide repeats